MPGRPGDCITCRILGWPTNFGAFVRIHSIAFASACDSESGAGDLWPGLHFGSCFSVSSSAMNVVVLPSRQADNSTIRPDVDRSWDLILLSMLLRDSSRKLPKNSSPQKTTSRCCGLFEIG